MNSYRSNVDNTEETLSICYRIYMEYSWFLNLYVSDFYTELLWDRLMKSWSSFMDDLPLENVGNLLNVNKSFKIKNSVMPLSLASLRYLLKRVCIPRIHTNDLSCDEASRFYSDQGLENLFRKNVKLKKRHELTEISKICYDSGVQCGCFYIVDIGSGLGHLSRMLAYRYGFNVVSIEADEKLSDQAKQLDKKFQKLASKYLRKIQIEKKVVYVNQRIEPTTTAEQLSKLVKTSFGINDDTFHFGIVGLHSCGDLAVALLRFYKNCKNIIFINIASCCYMKLPTSTSLEDSFPVSKYCKKKKYSLSYNCRELACHAIEMYVEKLRTGDYCELKIHAYRAVIEKLIVSNWPHLRHCHLKNIKYKESLGFAEYCKNATTNLGIVLHSQLVSSEDVANNLSQWSRVVKFYSIRLMLAPLVETIILLDRLLYLTEAGGSSSMVAAFDPRLSPRNQILSAVNIDDLHLY